MRVIPSLDELEDGSARLVVVVEVRAVEQLAFEGCEEALGHGVVEAPPDRAHRRHHAPSPAAFTEGEGVGLAALDQTGQRATAPRFLGDRLGVRFTRQPITGLMITHPGVYCLRSNQTDWDESTLWRTYFTLTDIEPPRETPPDGAVHARALRSLGRDGRAAHRHPHHHRARLPAPPPAGVALLPGEPASGQQLRRCSPGSGRAPRAGHRRAQLPQRRVDPHPSPRHDPTRAGRTRHPRSCTTTSAVPATTPERTPTC